MNLGMNLDIDSVLSSWGTKFAVKIHGGLHVSYLFQFFKKVSYLETRNLELG